MNLNGIHVRNQIKALVPTTNPGSESDGMEKCTGGEGEQPKIEQTQPSLAGQLLELRNYLVFVQCPPIAELLQISCLPLTKVTN